MTYAVSAIIIENEKILLVKKKDTWILPGGKPEPKESLLECLCREVKEELSETELKNLRFRGTSGGITSHTKENLFNWVYFADINGKLNSPSEEIEAYKWISKQDIKKYNISDVTSRVINSLIKYNKL